jgi:ribosomal protein S18 acetylase RimI-like enzyme
MNVREATRDDGEAIRQVARDSMESSYSLSPRAIDGAITQWYDDEGLSEMLNEDDTLLLVAEEVDDVRGFAESDLVNEGGNGDLLWLHVDPDYRGQGIGTALFERTREALDEMGAAQLRAKVLDDNTEGNDFYTAYGFEQVGTDTVEIDDGSYVENIYLHADDVEVEPTTESSDPVRPLDDQGLYVNEEQVERGSKAPFLTAFTDPEFEEEDKHGYFCTNCESLDNAMDTMGRVKCNDCGNLRKATRWDATHG